MSILHARRRLKFAGWIASLSLAFAEAHASDLVPPNIVTRTPGGVNLADGQYMYEITEISIGSLKLSRIGLSNNSPSLSTPFFGLGVTANFDIYVAQNYTPATPPPLSVAAHNQPIVHIGGNASGVYTQDLTYPTYVGPFNDDANAGELSYSGSDFTYVDAPGAIYHFSASVPAGTSGTQRVVSITYPGGRIETYSYNSSHQLKVVSDNAGYAIVFDYASSGVSAACGYNLSQTYVDVGTTCEAAALKTGYGYSSGPRLTTSTDTLANTTSYTFAGSGYGSTMCITPPGAAGCQTLNTYNATGQITQQNLADGSVWTIVSQDPFYSRDPDYVPADCDASPSWSGPEGTGVGSTYTKSTPCSMTDANGNITNYHFTGAALYTPGAPMLSEGSMLLSVTMPEGNQYSAEYHGPYNTKSKETWQAKPSSGLPDAVVYYGFGDCVTAPSTRQNCAKPTSIQDARGNTTNYGYTSFGEVSYEMQPQPQSGLARPLKTYAYAQVYASYKNSGGGQTAFGSPIWLKTSETTCQTALGSVNTPTCDGGALITTTTYEYGAQGTVNQLLLTGQVVDSGSGKLNLRTCYTYDWQGNRVSETKPRGTSSTCPGTTGG